MARQQRIEQRLAKRHLAEGSLALYDVSSTYFEGRQCPLARFGHSRDGKRDKRQIVFGVLSDPQGCPVAVEVFAGNTADPKTAAAQVKKLRERFGLARLVLVGDRGMITSARIREDLGAGGDWISALRAPAIAKLVDSGSLPMGLFDHRDLAEITDPAYPGERLVVCRNPLLAQERARKREDLLGATARELAKVAAATTRARNPLRDQTAIALRVGKLLGRFKMKKHSRLELGEDRFGYQRHQERIEREAALDGVYVIRTSVAAERLSSQDAVRSYKNLAVVERAFRSLKRVDLKRRPIHHHRAQRVRAHVLLCMLAYYLEWHIRAKLAPKLFDDDDQPQAARLRRSVVAAAQRSPTALSKARSKRTDDGGPVHSFRTLLADLATVANNRVRHQRAGEASFDLLGVSLRM